MNIDYCITWRNRDKSTYLRFHCGSVGDLKNLDAVTQTEIIISGLKQKEFEIFCAEYADKFQIVQLLHCNLINDFSPLERLQNLQCLVIDWNGKATKLWDMSNNISLKVLFIETATKILSLDGVETAPSLLEFGLKEGLEKKQSIDSLEPLSKIKSLRKINIWISDIKDNSILPIMKMRALEVVNIRTDTFETEQFAELNAKLKSIKISPNVPYYIFNKNDVGNNNVLVVGKGKRYISENSPKLQQYEAEWNEYIRKYSH